MKDDVMEAFPFDTTHPAVRDYLALVRLQVLTPISLLINVAVVVVCATIASPNIAQVAHTKPTAISPNASLIALYVLVIYLGQIGTCCLLVLARKPETKRALTTAVGFSLVIANWVMAFWALAFVLQFFLAATIFQGILLLLLLYSNVALLLYHPPTSERPFDTALIHAPMRFFLFLPMGVLFPYCLFVTLGMVYHPTPIGPPAHYSAWHAWSGFVTVMSTNLIALIVIVLRRDIVWCVAATWICVSLWIETPKPALVYVPTLAFTVLHPLSLLAAMLYHRYYGPRPIALVGDNNDPIYARNDRRANPSRRNSLAREVDVEEQWGSG